MKFSFSLFETKTASAFCLLIAIVNRIVNVMYVSFTGRDEMILVMQTKSLLEGHGLCIPKYFTTQLENPIYDCTQLWPPGYSLTLAPFLKVLNYNIYWATTTLEILASLALIFIIRKLCAQAGFPPVAKNIMTVVAGCFDYPFIYESQPTDTLSLLFLLVGISFTLQPLKQAKFSFIKLLPAGILLFLPCVFRYAYPPVSLAIAFSIFLYGLFAKNKLLLKKGISITIIISVLLILLFITLKLTTGQSTYIIKTERGFYPQNLVHWFPVIPASFIDLPFFTSLLRKYTALDFKFMIQALEIINYGFILFLLAWLIHTSFKKILYQTLPFAWVLALGIIASIAIMVSLGFLSFTYQAQKGFFYNWNYISEPRYFASVMVFLQFLFIGWIFFRSSKEMSLLGKVFLFTGVILLFIEITHNLYFHTKVAFRFNKYKSEIYREQDYKYFNSLLITLKRKNTDSDILVAASHDDYYPCTASYYDAKGVYDPLSLIHALPKIKKPTLLVLIIYDTHMEKFEPLLSKPGIKKMGRIDNSNFFMMELSSDE